MVLHGGRGSKCWLATSSGLDTMRWLRGVLLLFPLSSAFAESDNLPWHADRPLTWGDFRGSVDGKAPPERVAMTAHSLGWTYEYSVETYRGNCSYRITELSATAKFQPAMSWVKPGQQTADVLNHEQGHFDLTEIHRRNFDVRAAAMVGIRRSCSSPQSPKRIQQEIKTLIEPLYDEVWEAHQSSQEAYDLETGHGTNAQSQAAWDQKIADWLTP